MVVSPEWLLPVLGDFAIEGLMAAEMTVVAGRFVESVGCLPIFGEVVAVDANLILGMSRVAPCPFGSDGGDVDLVGTLAKLVAIDTARDGTMFSLEGIMTSLATRHQGPNRNGIIAVIDIPFFIDFAVSIFRAREKIDGADGTVIDGGFPLRVGETFGMDLLTEPGMAVCGLGAAIARIEVPGVPLGAIQGAVTGATVANLGFGVATSLDPFENIVFLQGLGYRNRLNHALASLFHPIPLRLGFITAWQSQGIGIMTEDAFYHRNHRTAVLQTQEHRDTDEKQRYKGKGNMFFMNAESKFGHRHSPLSRTCYGRLPSVVISWAIGVLKE
jgi:hypothetical protein